MNRVWNHCLCEATSEPQAILKMDTKLDNLLSSYRGTLSVKDQRTFLELRHFDHMHSNLISEDGYIVFGKFRNKSEDLKSDEKGDPKSDPKSDPTEDPKNDQIDQKDDDASKASTKSKKRVEERPLTRFLKQFKQPLIKSSIFSFPPDLELDQVQECAHECLDPRFLLLSFYQLINARKVTLEEFIDNNCLAIVFVSLSFHDEHLRRLGYSVLSKFKQTLCSETYGTIWRIVLDKLAASLQEENQRLPPVIASFFVHIIPFLKSPTYSIYDQLTKFLTNYPNFKFSSIVAFIFSMLITDDLELNTFYQDVALLMLRNGMKTEEDFALCLHCKIIDFLLINYNSPILFKAGLKAKVLDIFLLIARLPHASKLLCTEKAFLLWLDQLIVQENSVDVLNKIGRIIAQLSEHDSAYYPLFQRELQMIRSVCLTKIDNRFERDL